MARRRGEKKSKGKAKKPEVIREDALRKLALVSLDDASKAEGIDLEDDKERAIAVDGMLARVGNGIVQLMDDAAICELEDLADAADEDDEDEDEDENDDD